MVKRKKISSVPEDDENGMTVSLGACSGDEAAKKFRRKLEGCDERESGDQDSEERNTKTDGEEIPNPAPTGPSSSTPTLSTPASTLAGPCSDPQPQTLSTPVSQNQDQHHFLRSSVRPPSKRLRKDAIGSTINGHSNARGKGAENGASVGVGCGQSGAPTGSAGTVPKTALRNLGSADKEQVGSSQKKVRRQWESWSAEEKNTFFQGLYEHGKDFEAIQSNIALKYKKKGKPTSMVKNKEQVRHFYYRTWHKISKYIDFTNEGIEERKRVYSRVLKKSSQELYSLICFAELRKKVGGLMDDKNAAKLNELIQHGVTTVRSKGRNLRIKAPMCRALKKLCDPDGFSDEEDQKPVRLPLKVPMELQPRSNHSWARVQSLAHNPRLRMVVELHRKVSSLIGFLKQKWTIQDQRIRKGLEEQEALAGQKKPPLGEEREELFLFPAESCTLTPLQGVARVVHSKAFCTVHWQESGKCRPGAKDHPAAQILGIQMAPRGPGRHTRTGAGETRRGDAAEAVDKVPALGAEDESKMTSPPSQNTPLSMLPPLSPGQGLTKGDPTQLEGTSGSGELAVRDQGVRCVRVQAKEGPWAGQSFLPHKDPVHSARVPSSANHCGAERATGSAPSPERLVAAAETLPPAGKAGCKDDAAPEPGSLEPRCGGAGGGAAEKEEGGGVAAGVGSRPAQHIWEEGWCSRSTENFTLAELYLMLGKPGKLQLDVSCAACCTSSPLRSTPNRSRSCGPPQRPPLKPSEEQALTPSGKARNHASVRGGKLMSPGAGSSGALAPVACWGVRNVPRSLLVPTGDADSVLFAVPATLPPNSRHGKMFSPNKEAELALRQQLESISKKSDILSKQRKSRSRHLRKPLVVQRTLLPRTTGDAPQHVCSFSIMSNSSAAGTGSFWPIKPSLPSVSRPLLPETSTLSSAPASQLSSAIDLAAKSAGIFPNSVSKELADPSRDRVGPLLTLEASPDPGEQLQQDSAEVTLSNGLPPLSLLGDQDSLLSPPSGLSGGESATHISDSIIELASEPSGYGPDSSLSHTKLSGSDKLLIGQPPVEPDISREGAKVGADPNGPVQRDPPSLDPSLLGLAHTGEVDSQFACMMSESSVDYIARFNDLAQELSINELALPPTSHGGSG
ncbi:hypothetical protein SKAU_G00286080 [Synaphobranchus kaupii]|uniref:Protein cramped-like n=1 Tax=Synaphobranchus kaupii TaxID=118154 RepID=A0A9Q1EY22_SYNKA|nr:hypothetical protein SKAU_G00286080 [Synaphobranchus kaupii]